MFCQVIGLQYNYKILICKMILFLFPGRSSRLTQMSNQWKSSKRNLSTNSLWKKKPTWRPVTAPPLKESRSNLRPQTTSWWIAVGYEACTVNQAKSPARYDVFSGHQFMTDRTICWAILPCFITRAMKLTTPHMSVFNKKLITLWGMTL